MSIRDLEKNIITRVLFEDVANYAQDVLDDVSQIVEAYRETGDPVTFKGINRSKASNIGWDGIFVEDIKEGCSSFMGYDRKPSGKDFRRITTQASNANSVSEAERISKIITDRRKKYRRGKAAIEKGYIHLARPYFVELAKDLDFKPEDFVDQSGSSKRSDPGYYDYSEVQPKLEELGGRLKEGHARVESLIDKLANEGDLDYKSKWIIDHLDVLIEILDHFT